MFATFSKILRIFFGVTRLIFAVWLKAQKKVADQARKSEKWLAPRLAIVLLLFSLIGCSSPASDVEEPAGFTSYLKYYCPFCDASKLPKRALTPNLQITNNYPRLAPWDMGLYPLASATAKVLYKNIDEQNKRQIYSYLFAYDPGIYPGLPNYPKFCQGKHILFKTDMNKLGKDLDLEDCLQERDIGFYRIPVFKTSHDIFLRLELGWGKPEVEITDYYDLIPLGWEAFVFFGDKRNSVVSLTLEQIQAIYNGQISNWQEVGGRNEPIIAYQRSRYSITQGIMESFVMHGKMPKSPTERRTNRITGGNWTDNVEYKHGRNAIGYCDRLTTLLYSPSRRIKLFAVDGVAPTDENIRSGRYPLIYEIMAIVPKRPKSQETRLVLNWLTGPEGQAYIGRLGYVPLADGRQSYKNH
jgi:hypothetical protein